MVVRSLLSPVLVTRTASVLSKISSRWTNPSAFCSQPPSSSLYRVVMSRPAATRAHRNCVTPTNPPLLWWTTLRSTTTPRVLPMASAAILTTHPHYYYSYSTLGSPRSTSVRPNTGIAAASRLGRVSPGVVGTALPGFLPAASLGTVAPFSSRGGVPGGSGGTPKGGGRMGMGAGLVTAGAVLLGKGKYILGALKLTKFASLASMFVSIGAYSMIFGLPYAAGMVGLILVHECGHALVMNHYKIPFSPMVFMPFMGAVIAMKDQPKDAWQDAVIAYGGPALGTAGALGVAAAAQLTDSQLLYALADFGFMVNMFNMIPIGNMDGGRILGALSPYFGVAGLGIGGGLVATGVVTNPLVLLILLAGGWSTFQRFYDPAGHQPSPNYYKITPVQRAVLGGSYIGLIGVIVAGMAVNGINKKPAEEIRRQYQELSYDEREF